jgi:hypothetical protein
VISVVPKLLGFGLQAIGHSHCDLEPLCYLSFGKAVIIQYIQTRKEIAIELVEAK